jgi:hypothetical protein
VWHLHAADKGLHPLTATPVYNLGGSGSLHPTPGMPHPTEWVSPTASLPLLLPQFLGIALTLSVFRCLSTCLFALAIPSAMSDPSHKLQLDPGPTSS